MKKCKVAILVLCTNEKHFLKECFDSLAEQTYADSISYMCDNNSDDGSVEFVKENYKNVEIIQNGGNLGYAKGNNQGMKVAFKNPKVDACLVLNSDIKADKKMVSELVSSHISLRNKNESVGMIQPVILLHDQQTKINTIGNAIHYLGFGYCKDYLKDYKPINSDKEIISVSGAALFISRDYYEKIGGFDEDFFIYNEDQNLSWRGLMSGYKHYLSAKAVLYHKYNFHRRPFKMYHSEKNRLMILLENYDFKTLIFLLPIFIFVEMCLLVYALLGGWFFFKLKSYWYVLTHLGSIIKKRKKVQGEKVISDKVLLERFISRLEFEVVQNPILDKIINPLLSFYKHLLLYIL